MRLAHKSKQLDWPDPIHTPALQFTLTCCACGGDVQLHATGPSTMKSEQRAVVTCTECPKRYVLVLRMADLAAGDGA